MPAPMATAHYVTATTEAVTERGSISVSNDDGNVTDVGAKAHRVEYKIKGRALPNLR